MELADVLDSKSSGSDTVRVRPPPPAPEKKQLLSTKSCFFSYPSRRLGISLFTILQNTQFIVIDLRKFLFIGEFIISYFRRKIKAQALYIINSEGIAYHQHEVLYIIKPQGNAR